MNVVRRDGAGREPELELDDDERGLLIHLFDQLDELLGADEDEVGEDEVGEGETGPGDSAAELAAMVGIGTSVHLPLDPALARLFPDAYSGDPRAAGDFRRYTEDRLRATKRGNLETVRAALAEEGPYALDERTRWGWLGALNDLRLVLGVRLDVDEEDDLEERLAGEDGEPYLIYVWLTEVQGALLAALEDPPG